jgi:hypothetical protein
MLAESPQGIKRGGGWLLDGKLMASSEPSNVQEIWACEVGKVAVCGEINEVHW